MSRHRQPDDWTRETRQRRRLAISATVLLLFSAALAAMLLRPTPAVDNRPQAASETTNKTSLKADLQETTPRLRTGVVVMGRDGEPVPGGSDPAFDPTDAADPTRTTRQAPEPEPITPSTPTVTPPTPTPTPTPSVIVEDEPPVVTEEPAVTSETTVVPAETTPTVTPTESPVSPDAGGGGGGGE